MAIRRQPGKGQLNAFQSRLRQVGPKQLGRADVEALQAEFAELSGDERDEAMQWLAKVRPGLAKLLGAA